MAGGVALAPVRAEDFMRFLETKVNGAFLIEPDPVGDARGKFMRTFCAEEFSRHGLETNFIQHSLSCSAAAGTLRGMHFQRPPHEEVKVVRCSAGVIFDVVLDLRPASPTFGRWQGFELSAENKNQLYIPKGCAHGFQSLCDDVEVNYLISDLYTPAAASGVRYDDPRFGLEWPLPLVVISDRDRAWPHYGSAPL
jgi:dTDP-4-dehydrorhamnose 3,5-epimerase